MFDVHLLFNTTFKCVSGSDKGDTKENDGKIATISFCKVRKKKLRLKINGGNVR